jgi:hypothetical protein
LRRIRFVAISEVLTEWIRLDLCSSIGVGELHFTRATPDNPASIL